MSRQYPGLQSLEIFVVGITSALVFFYAVFYPLVHWDHIAYAAVAFDWLGHDITTVHAMAYQELKGHASAVEFDKLINFDEYRSTMHADPEALRQQFPYYSMRVLYMLPLVVCAKLGVNLYSAINFLGALYHALGLLILYAGLRKVIGTIFWLLLPAIFYLVTKNLFVVSTNGVDSMAFLWACMISLAFLRNSKWLYFLLITAVMVRTDAIIFVFLMLAFNICVYRSELRMSFMTGVASVVVYFLINHFAGNYGWSTLFYFVFVSDLQATHPETYSTYAVDFKTYLSHVLNPDWIPGVLCMSLVLWSTIGYLCVRKISSDSDRNLNSDSGYMRADDLKLMYKTLVLSNVAVLYIFLHYLLFPLMRTRFFYSYYLIVFVCFGCACTMVWRSRKSGAMPQQAVSAD